MMNGILSAARKNDLELRPRDSAPPQFAIGRDEPLEIEIEATLIAAVSRTLREAGYPALRHVKVEYLSGVVVLWGVVPSYYQKQLAQAVAQRVEGVRRIANGLEVICSNDRRTP